MQGSAALKGTCSLIGSSVATVLLLASTPINAALNKVFISPLILLPDSNISIGEVREIGYGEALFTGRVVLSEAAIPEPAPLNLTGLHLELDPKSPLRKASLATNDARALPDARIYCSNLFSTTAAQRRPREVSQSGPRFRSNIRYCLIDSDADSKFDHGFVDGALWTNEKDAVAIEPLAFKSEKNTPIPGKGAFGIVFIKQAAISDSEVAPLTDMLDGQLRVADVNIGNNPEGTWTNRRTSVTPTALPKVISYADGQITILSMDGSTKKIKFRIDKPISATQIGFNFEKKFTTISSMGMFTNLSYEYVY